MNEASLPWNVEAPARRLARGLVPLAAALRGHAWERAHLQRLTPTQGRILEIVRSRRERAVRLTDLARALVVTPATASDAVSALARKGLVRKKRGAADARALALSLTAKGRRAAEQVSSWPAFLVASLESLSRREQETSLIVLAKVIGRLHRRGDIAASASCGTCRFFRPSAYEDARRPHHCAYLDVPFGNPDLQLDCFYHEPGDAERVLKNLQTLDASARPRPRPVLRARIP